MSAPVRLADLEPPHAGITVFVCASASDRPRCETPGCHRAGSTRCAYELRGKRAGETCGRVLCAGCAHQRDGQSYCHPHDELLRAAAAAAEGRR